MNVNNRIDREYDRTTGTCQISDLSRDYRTRTSRDWSRAIKNSVTMHGFLALSFSRFFSLPSPLSLCLSRRCDLACFTAVKRVGSRVWSTRVLPMCAHADGRGWRGCRGTDLLRGRPGSCPTLSRYTIIFLVVCALVSPRERYRPPFFFLSALPFVSWSVLQPCISSFFYPSPRPSWTRRRRSSLPHRSLPRQFVCLLDVLYLTFLSMLNWIIYRNEILFKKKSCLNVSHLSSLNHKPSFYKFKS